MPELPEVETVRRGLLKKVGGKTISSCTIKYTPIIEYPTPEEFIREIQNKTIKDIRRQGKFLIFDLDTHYLISHLRMEGKYFIKSQEEPYSKHDHVIFLFTDNQELRYNDTRKFGKMYLVPKDELSKTPIAKLGLEPFSENLTVAYLKDKLSRNMPIKTLLLDQSIIAGIGNIYADEILFASKINPTTKGLSLTDKNLQDIINSTKTIMANAIEKGGTTIHTYTSVDGITGLFQQELKVHTKITCPECGRIIEKTTVGGRGTYYCPNCQK